MSLTALLLMCAYMHTNLYAQSVDYNDVDAMLIPFRRKYVIYHSNGDDWHSNSMAGVFGINSTLILEPEPKGMQVGDIVSIDGLFTHRIIAINGTCIQTAGDNNDGASESECDAHVRYRVIGVIYTRGVVKEE